MPIKQVGGTEGVPNKTYSQFTKHKQETQLNQNKGQCPMENTSKHYALIHIVGSFRQYMQVYKITRRKAVQPDDHQLLLVKHSDKLI